jgi:hypothetical protein
VFKAAVVVLVSVLALLGFHIGSAARSSSAQAAADPLVGTWDTAPIPVAKLRAALAAHGYTAASIDKMFHNLAFLNHISKSIEFEIRFYRETDGTPFQIVRFWDPTTRPKPAYGDHGPYKLLPGNRVEYTGTDPPTDTYRTTFSYAIHGNRLTLHFVSLVEPGLSAKQRLADQKRPIMQAAAPYAKVGA